MSTAAGYIRVSTEEQVKEGLSIEAQHERLGAYCELRKMELGRVFVDGGVSGSVQLHKRRGGGELLEQVRVGQYDAVVAFKLDRIFRNARDCLAVVDGWNKAKVAFHLVDMGGQAIDTSSAMGRFFLTIMAGVAELERNQVSERIKSIQAYKRTRGEWLGGHAPYGWEVDGKKLVEVPEELAVVERVQELRGLGASIRQIASVLEKEGVRTRRGRPMHFKQVQRILKTCNER